MIKSKRNSGKRWTKADEQKLKKLAKENTPTRVIGLKMGRTASAIQNKASELNQSLKPHNRSPYNMKK